MDHKRGSDEFKTTQGSLLASINRHKQIDHDFLEDCNRFLCNQSNRLEFLNEQRRVYLDEKGKFIYRLLSEEKVSLTLLKTIYSDFAELLHSFFRLLDRSSHASLKTFKLVALQIAREMLKTCVVLDFQPESFHYEKQKNEIPDLRFLGAHCLSDFKVTDIKVTVVNQSDLLSASHEGMPLKTVQGLKNVTMNKQGKKTKKSKTKEKQVVERLGCWGIPTDKYDSIQKGRAHKDFLRLRYTMQISYKDVTEDVMLLSLPFLIRKSSCQLYTFQATLMWYFYHTAKPYEEFEVKDKLSEAQVVDMLTDRIAAIGRPVSPTASHFFTDRVKKLSRNGMMDLEVLAKGYSTVKEEKASQEHMHEQGADQDQRKDKTRTVDEAVEIYGLSTWFFAMAKSLDKTGYLHELWIYNYIFDICEVKLATDLVEDPNFAYNTAILRPSMSEVYNNQSEKISMGLAFFYKKDAYAKAINSRVSVEDVEKCGFLLLLEYLRIKFVFRNNKTNSFGYVMDPAPEGLQAIFKDYHTSRVRMATIPIVVDDNQECTCCCHGKAVTNAQGEMDKLHTKKARTPSGHSDEVTSSCDWQQMERMFHKRAVSNAASMSPSDSHCSMEPSIKNGFDNSPSEQLTNQTFLTSPFSDRPESTAGCSDSDSGIESQMSPDNSHLPSLLQQDVVEPTSELTQSTTAVEARKETISDLFNAFNTFYVNNIHNVSNEKIQELTSLFKALTEGDAMRPTFVNSSYINDVMLTGACVEVRGDLNDLFPYDMYGEEMSNISNLQTPLTIDTSSSLTAEKEIDLIKQELMSVTLPYQ